MATYSDDFEAYSDGDAITTLGNWVSVSTRTPEADAFGNMVITATGSGKGIWDQTLGADQYSEIVIDRLTASVDARYIGVCARFSNSTDNGYALDINRLGEWFLGSVTSGSFSTIASGTLTEATIVDGDKVRLECESTTISFFYDSGSGYGTARGSVTDTDYSSGYSGIFCFNSTDGQLGIASWEGGDLGGGSIIQLIQHNRRMQQG